MKKLSGIYKLSWPDLDEGHFYYGQSRNMIARRGQHFRALKNGTHDNPILQRVFDKYGYPEFEYVAFIPSRLLDRKEQQLLNTFIGYPGCCNINPSVVNHKGWIRSEETRKKLSILRTGVTLSDAHKKSIGIGLRKAYHDGRKTIRPLRGNNNPFFGKRHSAETRSKMTGKSKGVGSSNVKARLVINLETGIFYDYAGEAAQTIGINPQYLRGMLNGDKRNKTAFVYA